MINEFGSEPREQRLGRYLWRSYYFGNGGWDSVEPHRVAPGDVRLIGDDLFYAFTVKPRWLGLRGYDVSWHRASPQTKNGSAWEMPNAE